MSDSEIMPPVSEELPALSPETDRAEMTGKDASRSGSIATSPRGEVTTLWQRVFSFPALLGALLVGAVATVTRTFFVDPDVWWHIKQGEFILTTRHVPTKDIYSLTLIGHPWTAYEWLGDVVLATAYRIGGMRGLEALLIILGSAILIMLYSLATIRSGNSKAAFVATAALFALAAVSFNLRPQMLGYLFLVLTLIVLERFRQGRRRSVWALPILMLIWVNMHGSWIIGLGVIGIYLFSGLVEFRIGDIEARRWSSSDRLRLASVLVLCAGATLFTPYGAGLAKYPFEVAFSLPLGVANVLEWQSISFGSFVGKIFLVALLGIIVFQVTHRFAWQLGEFTLFLFATIEACLHVRFLLIFVPILAPVLATILARWVPRYEQAKDRYLLNAALMAVVLTGVLWYFPTQSALLQDVGRTYPVGAVEYLDHHSVPGPMYNTYDFGGYMLWSRGPGHKVFMDGRSELYERGGVLADYLAIADIKPGALSLLRKYGIQSCLINHDEPLARVLAALPDWQKVYEDSTSILFVRTAASAFGLQSSDAAPEIAHDF